MIMAPVQGAAESRLAKGHLTVASSDRMFQITAVVAAHTASPIDVTATLSVAKNDASGNITTQQSKNLQLSDGDSVNVATTSVSLDTVGKIVISLTIMDAENVLDQTIHTIERNTSD